MISLSVLFPFLRWYLLGLCVSSSGQQAFLPMRSCCQPCSIRLLRQTNRLVTSWSIWPMLEATAHYHSHPTTSFMAHDADVFHNTSTGRHVPLPLYYVSSPPKAALDDGVAYDPAPYISSIWTRCCPMRAEGRSEPITTSGGCSSGPFFLILIPRKFSGAEIGPVLPVMATHCFLSTHTMLYHLTLANISLGENRNE